MGNRVARNWQLLKHLNPHGAPNVFKYPNPMNLEARGIKTFRSMEGGGYEASIYKDGKKVIDLLDEGNGGQMLVEPIGEQGKRVEAELKALCATLPKDADYGVEIDVTLDIYLDELVNETVDQRKMDRLRKKSTLFRLTTDRGDGYRTINTPDVAKARAFLDKKFPGNYVLI